MESFGIAKLSGKAFVDGDLAVEVKEMTFGTHAHICIYVYVYIFVCIMVCVHGVCTL